MLSLGVGNIEEETEPTLFPILKAMVTESVAEPLATVLDAMVTNQEMDPSTLVPGPKSL